MCSLVEYPNIHFGVSPPHKTNTDKHAHTRNTREEYTHIQLTLERLRAFSMSRARRPYLNINMLMSQLCYSMLCYVYVQTSRERAARVRVYNI